jgi:PAS domain S-box-containing protein
MTDKLSTLKDRCAGNETALQTVLRMVPIAMGIARASDGKLLIANAALRALFGLPADGTIDFKTPEMYCNLDDRHTLLTTLERDGHVTDFEIQVQRADGTPLWVALSAEYLVYEGQQAVLSTFNHITHRKQHGDDLARRTSELENANTQLIKTNRALLQAQQEMQEFHERFKQIAEFIPVPIAIALKATGKVRFVNDHMARLYGLTEGEQLMDREMTDFFFDVRDRATLVQVLERQGHVSNWELRYKRADGTPFWVEAYFRYMNYEGEAAIFGALVDISERKRHSEELEQRVKERTAALEESNQQLQEAVERAETANQEKNRFLASVSHELRTPLNHILGFCQLLERSAIDAGQKRDLGFIRSAGEHLQSLIDDILDYQKIILGQMPMAQEDFKAARWIKEIAQTTEPRIREQGNRLEVECVPDLGYVRADRTRFRQVLTNLLGNAAKFTVNGVVTVRAWWRQVENTDWIYISVSDTGKGIDPENFSKLFKPFVKLDRRDNPQGTGLGLAICRMLCQKMGGDIDVTSSPGTGSTFTFWLPAAPGHRSGVFPVLRVPKAGEQPPAEARTGRAEPSRSVLVIDDDPQVGELMKRFFEREGFAIHVALGGHAALDLAKSLRPTVITLDMLMPGMDGWTVLAQLKHDEEVADIPVIILSIVDDRSRGFLLGADEYVTKPVDWPRLAVLLRKYAAPQGDGILIVEDDPIWREVCVRALNQNGWQVFEAEDGESALHYLAQSRPSLILLDLVLPMMDGFQFLDRVRSHAEWQGIPIIVMTAKQLTDEERSRLNGAVLAILEKGRRQLDDLLEDVLHGVKQYVLAPRN